MTTFDYAKPTDEQVKRIQNVREAFNQVFGAVQANCLPNRETSLTVTKLEEACMWATKGIVFEGK